MLHLLAFSGYPGHRVSLNTSITPACILRPISLMRNDNHLSFQFVEYILVARAGICNGKTISYFDRSKKQRKQGYSYKQYLHPE